MRVNNKTETEKNIKDTLLNPTQIESYLILCFVVVCAQFRNGCRCLFFFLLALIFWSGELWPLSIIWTVCFMIFRLSNRYIIQKLYIQERSKDLWSICIRFKVVNILEKKVDNDLLFNFLISH